MAKLLGFSVFPGFSLLHVVIILLKTRLHSNSATMARFSTPPQKSKNSNFQNSFNHLCYTNIFQKLDLPPQSAQHWRDEVASLYEKATKGLLKNNLLLHFAFADYEESRMKTKECHDIYTNLVSTVPDPTLVIYLINESNL